MEDMAQTRIARSVLRANARLAAAESVTADYVFELAAKVFAAMTEVQHKSDASPYAFDTSLILAAQDPDNAELYTSLAKTVIARSYVLTLARSSSDATVANMPAVEAALILGMSSMLTGLRDITIKPPNALTAALAALDLQPTHELWRLLAGLETYVGALMDTDKFMRPKTA